MVDLCEAGGIVWLSTLSAARDAEMADEAEQIFSRATQLLAAKGFALADIVRTVDYVLPSARDQYAGTAAVRARRFAGIFPVSTGVFMPGETAGHPFALNVVAQRQAHAAQRGDHGQTTFVPYLRHGDFLWFAGFVGRASADTSSAYPPGIAEQAHNTHRRIAEGLREAGASSADVVRIVDYVVPSALNEYPAVLAQRRADFGGWLPATTVAVVDRLIRTQALIEVEATAVMTPLCTAAARGTDGPAGAPSVVQRGPWLFTSGIGGEGAGIEDHAAACYRRLRAVLASANPQARVVQVSHYCDAATPISMERLSSLLREEFHGDSPAVTLALTPRQYAATSMLTIDAIAVSGNP